MKLFAMAATFALAATAAFADEVVVAAKLKIDGMT